MKLEKLHSQSSPRTVVFAPSVIVSVRERGLSGSVMPCRLSADVNVGARNLVAPLNDGPVVAKPCDAALAVLVAIGCTATSQTETDAAVRDTAS